MSLAGRIPGPKPVCRSPYAVDEVVLDDLNLNGLAQFAAYQRRSVSTSDRRRRRRKHKRTRQFPSAGVAVASSYTGNMHDPQRIFCRYSRGFFFVGYRRRSAVDPFTGEVVATQRPRGDINGTSLAGTGDHVGLE